ncbi:MAG: lipoate protein ligase C-terminal domain-containing protein [Candidatus Thermoplasmatota archaeon]
MHARSTYKIPNGKLLKIDLEYDQTTRLIEDIKIRGDFFAHPEESVEALENELKKTRLNEDELKSKINSLIKKYNINFIGVDAEGLTQGILRCIN